MGINMGMHPLLAQGGDKRKFRWLFSIQPFIGNQVSMLPPYKGARPNLSFKEYQVEHLNETIYFPGRVEWQNVELSMYDVRCTQNPVYEWMKRIYNPDPTSNNNKGFYGPSLSPPGRAPAAASMPARTIYSKIDFYFPPPPPPPPPTTTLPEPKQKYKTTAIVALYNGCGVALEQWVYQNAYPVKIDWGDLDMNSSDLTTVDISLRFDRAYRIALAPFNETVGTPPVFGSSPFFGSFLGGGF